MYRSMAQAILALNEKGWEHGDVKPGNVIVTDDGVKLIDFGCSHEFHDVKQDDWGFGTPGYVSFWAACHKRHHEAADCHSLGMTMLEDFLIEENNPFAKDAFECGWKNGRYSDEHMSDSQQLGLWKDLVREALDALLEAGVDLEIAFNVCDLLLLGLPGHPERLTSEDIDQWPIFQTDNVKSNFF